MKKLSNITLVIIFSCLIVYSTQFLNIGGSKGAQSALMYGPPLEGVDTSNEIPDHVRPATSYMSLESILTGVSPDLVSPQGTREVLVILVDFNDTAGTRNAAFFDTMYWGASPSVNDYFTEVSYNAFTYIRGDVLDPGNNDSAPFYYTYPNTLAWAAAGNNARLVAAWAITQADADFNYGPYDTDSSTIVENDELTIVVVTSGTAGDMGGSAPWSHHWWTVGNVATGDGVSVEGEYSMTSEANPMGTHAHELGHDIGLPDLYDTDGGSAGIGHYGLMGSGSWCGPTHMTAWSKIQLGWLTPTIVVSNAYYDVDDVETNAEAYVLANTTFSTTEYFLIENRWRGTSYDSFNGLEGNLDDQGILIYHIEDAEAAGWWASGTNDVNAEEQHKGVDVECSDFPTSHVVNADDLDTANNRGDSNDLWDINEYDFYDGSVPCSANWYVTNTSGMDVRDLPAPGPTMRVALSIEDVWAPFADANGPYTGSEGSPITFNASTSYDLNGNIVLYEWDWGNDGTYDESTGSSTTTHTWGSAFTGTVGLRVTDDEGLNDTDTASVTVDNVIPTVEAGKDQTVYEGDMVYFNGNFTDPSWLDTHTAFWYWGDTASGPGVLTEENIPPDATGNVTGSHAYGDNGLYTVELQVTDNYAGVGSDTLEITVKNVSPTIILLELTEIEYSCDQISVEMRAEFTDPGWLDTHTAVWDWGDSSSSAGVVTEENVAPDSTGSVTGSHVYTNSDFQHFYVGLTVYDDDGGWDDETYGPIQGAVGGELLPVQYITMVPPYILTAFAVLLFTGIYYKRKK
jgi:M6 family metalloprotease-like protein